MCKEALIEAIEVMEEIDRRMNHIGLLDFVEKTFPETDAGKFERGWFHEIIAKEIEEWYESEDNDFLMLFMPPRHGKSQIVSRNLPAYLFGRNPDLKIIATTYAQDLANDMGSDVQQIIMSDTYRDIFPHVGVSQTRTRDDTKRRTMSRFDVVGGAGYYLGKGVGGGIAGRGGDIIIIDDPVKNREEAESETYREKTWKWYTSTLRTRLQRGGKIILLMTRWHEDDLAGKLLEHMKSEPEADQWKVISFPALLEENEYNHPEDQRELHEPLWPEMFNLQALKKTRASSGVYDWSALYQQTPIPPGGAVIKKDWLQVIPKAPEGLIWVRAWDLAVTKKTSADFSGSGQMAIDKDQNIYVRKLIRMQDVYPKVEAKMIDTLKREKILTGVETQGTQKAFVDLLLVKPELAGLPIQGFTVSADKLTRALTWVPRAEAGKFFIIDGHGVDQYIDELIHFTGKDDKHDDQVDWTSLAYRMLADYQEVEFIHVGDVEFD